MQPFTPHFKRKRNRIPLNFLSGQKGKKKRYKFAKEEVAISLPNPIVSPTAADSPPDNYVECHEQDDATLTPTVSAHTRRKEKLAEKWNALRTGAYKKMIHTYALPPSRKCAMCNNDDATVRCQQCGPLFMCKSCCFDIHSQLHYHHFPELWQDDCFVPLKLPPVTLKISSHECDTTFFRIITCFHIEGAPCNLNIQFCKCQPDALRLMELGYWPATPSCPGLAFTYSFMNWMEALLLECQVAVQDFSSAIEMLVKEKLTKMPCCIYPVLIDTFEEFRHLKEEIRQMKGLIDNIFTCPACPKEQGTITLSIDANFGLCRKKAAGSSVHGPLSGTTIFCDQHDVNNFVANYEGVSSRISSDCNEFLAGHALRSHSRFAALSETAIMGVVCRHEHPLCFINLFHGERIAYCVYILERLKSMYPNHEVQAMYDIACVLAKHLKANKRDDLLSKYSFAVPVFHAYGHTAECQILRNPRNISGYGLSDGEAVERLWSYLRRFSAMTKEMRPAHRIDVLSHAISHYGRCATENIGVLLCRRIDNAKHAFSEAKKNLQILQEESSEMMTEANISAWAREAKIHFSDEPSSRSIPATWQETYVEHLDSFLSIRIEMLLQKIENEHEISRWTPSSQAYKETKEMMKSKLRNKLKIQIRQYARERWFLLRLKSKYADGQKIAIRLSRRITVVTKSLKKCLNTYNTGIDASCHLSWVEAVNLSSEIYTDCFYSDSAIPNSIKYQAVQFYQQMSRAEEEVVRIKDEMLNCVHHFIGIYECLIRQTEFYKHSEDETQLCKLGKICLLKRANIKCFNQLKSLQCFMKYTEMNELQTFLTTLCQLQDDSTTSEQGSSTVICLGPNVRSNVEDGSLQNPIATSNQASLNPPTLICTITSVPSQTYNPVQLPSSHDQNTLLIHEPNVFTASPDKNHDESLSNQNVSMQSANDHGFHSTGTVSYRDSLQGTSHTISNVNPNSSMQSFAYLEKSQHNGSVSNQEYDLSAVYLDADYSESLSPQQSAASNQASECNLPHNDESTSPSESEEESDEEMEIQDWRKQKFIRESYLESIRSIDDDFSELMTSLQGVAPIKISEREKEFTGKSMSYLAIPKEDLRNSIRLVELAEKRAEKREKLQKMISRGPFFEITRTSK